VYFNANLKLLTKLINSAFVGEWTTYRWLCLISTKAPAWFYDKFITVPVNQVSLKQKMNSIFFVIIWIFCCLRFLNCNQMAPVMYIFARDRHERVKFLWPFRAIIVTMSMPTIHFLLSLRRKFTWQQNKPISIVMERKSGFFPLLLS